MSFTIELEQEQDYEFRVKFDRESVPSLLVDELEPVGHDRGPNPDRLLAVAVANCLTASLLFCMRKFKQTPNRRLLWWIRLRVSLAPNKRLQRRA